jgi:hypothetical protein
MGSTAIRSDFPCRNLHKFPYAWSGAICVWKLIQTTVIPGAQVLKYLTCAAPPMLVSMFCIGFGLAAHCLLEERSRNTRSRQGGHEEKPIARSDVPFLKQHRMFDTNDICLDFEYQASRTILQTWRSPENLHWSMQTGNNLEGFFTSWGTTWNYLELSAPRSQRFSVACACVYKCPPALLDCEFVFFFEN